MSPRVRFLAIFVLGFAAAVGAGWAALAPLRQADAAASLLFREIAGLRDAVAALDPGAPGDPNDPSIPSRSELLGHLDRAEREFSMRRAAIVDLAVIHLAIALAAGTSAFWLAVALASRGASRIRSERTDPPLVAAPAPAPAQGTSSSPPTVCSTVRSFVAEPSGRLTSVSEAIARDFGCPREDLVGEPVTTLFAPGARPTIESIFSTIGPTRPSAQVDIAIGVGADEIWMRLRLHARLDEEGSIDSVVGEGREITEIPEEIAEAIAKGGVAEPSESDLEDALDPNAPTDESRPDPARLTGTQIVVALRGKDQRRLVKFLLGQVGARVTAVADGRQLVDVLEAGDPCDVVLLEAKLPLLDGLATTRRLRELGHELPIVALVQSGDSGARRLCLEAGCTGTAPKPVDRRSLIAALAAVLPQLDPA